MISKDFFEDQTIFEKKKKRDFEEESELLEVHICVLSIEKIDELYTTPTTQRTLFDF